jgi:hypothetical protein
VGGVGKREDGRGSARSGPRLGRRSVTIIVAVLVVAAGVVAFVSTRSSMTDDRPDALPTAENPTRVEVTLEGTTYRSDTDKVVPGWVLVTFHNRTDDSRDLALVRLGRDKTAADLDAALEDPRALEALGGTYVFEGGATMVPPRSTVSFRTEVFTGQFLFGALPDLARGSGRPATLEVGAGDPPLTDPRTPSTIRLGAFSHGLLGDIRTSGPQALSVVGEGPAGHEVRLYKVQDGVAPTAAFATVPAMKDAPERATASVRPELGVAAMDPGFVNVRDIALTPGDYVMTCFLVDADTGKTYAELGMITPFSVT